MGTWSNEEVETLKTHWTAPPDLKKLRELLGRSSASIYERARELGLPKLSYAETIAVRNRDLVAEQKVVFLQNYKACRYEREAHRKSGTHWQGVRNWMERDPEFKKSFQDVEEYIASTKRCVYCGLTDQKGLFRPDGFGTRNQWKTGICRKCDSNRVQGQHEKSLGAKLKHLWKSSKSSVKSKRTGGNIPPECTITPDDLMRMYEAQEGRCHYTGLPMKYKREGIRDFDLLSLDRKNPKLGYVLENVVLCRWGANQMKRDVPHDEFVEFCKSVAARFP